MSDDTSAGALARIWIEHRNEGAPDLIPLASGFKHTSPFGCVEGRERYLEWVKPLAAKNVTELRIRRVLSSRDEATIHLEMDTPGGLVQCCDWVMVEDGEITEIHSFYDTTGLRKHSGPA